MPAPPVQPIVIWFGRVGDLILMSALLEILHRRFGGPCHLIGAGPWPAQLYAAHRDVARVSCLHRYTAWVFDPAWWRTLRALRIHRANGPGRRPTPHLQNCADALGRPPGELWPPDASGIQRGRLPVAGGAPAALRAAPGSVRHGARRVRRVARAARVARPDPDTGAARQPPHHAWPAAARLGRGRQGLAARTLGGAAAPGPRAAAAGGNRGVRGPARVFAARMDP